jgi:hypothetical protein
MAWNCFLVNSWLVLSVGKHKIFSIKVYVGIKTLCIDKIWWMVDTWHNKVPYVTLAKSHTHQPWCPSLFTISNALLRGSLESSIGIMPFRTLVALAGVCVEEAFNIIRYWWRMVLHNLVNGLRAQQKEIAQKLLRESKYYFEWTL